MIETTKRAVRMARGVLGALALLGGTSALAAPAAVAAAPTKAGFQKFLLGTWPDAEKVGVSKATFNKSIAGLEPDFSLPELEGISQRKPNTAQAEFLRPAGNYLSETQIAGLAKRGRVVAEKYREALDGIAKKHGARPSVLLAIFGRETDFGKERTTKSVLQVIATQAYAGRRKEYFRNQFVWALKILEDGDVTPAGFTGSWAGAFGLTQFMPTGFRDYAQDFDGDGKRNVWTSVPDALASSAVELNMSIDRDGTPVGWQRGKPWGFEVRKPKGMDCTLGGFDRPKPLKDWVKLGFTRAYGKPFRAADLNDPAFLLLPEGSNGPAFLVFNNFLALKVYNYADLYALFVGHLADRIDGGEPIEAKWAESTHLTEAQVFDLQNKLIALGHDIGKVDGKIGSKMRLAIGEFQKSQKLPVRCYPSEADLAALDAAQ
jgi:lytic murein transglycosylase